MLSATVRSPTVNISRLHTKAIYDFGLTGSSTLAQIRKHIFNSLDPGTCNSTFINVLPEHMQRIKFTNTSWEIAFRWMSESTLDDKSTLVQAMAWCRQAPSHFLSRCLPIFLSPHVVTRLYLPSRHHLRVWHKGNGLIWKWESDSHLTYNLAEMFWTEKLIKGFMITPNPAPLDYPIDFLSTLVEQCLIDI